MSGVWETQDKYIRPVITEEKRRLIGHSEANSGQITIGASHLAVCPQTMKTEQWRGQRLAGDSPQTVLGARCPSVDTAITIRCAPVILGPLSPPASFVHLTSSSQIWVGQVL